MRSTKKYLAFACTALAAAGLVTGCGSSGGGGGGTGNTAAPTTGASTPAGTTSSAASLPDLSGKSYTVLGQWTGGEQAAFQAVIDAFDKQTGAKGHYTPAAGGNEAGVLGTKVAGGAPPDIAILSLPGAIAQYGSANKIYPLAPDVQAAVKANFSSEWATLGSYNGTMYGVPFDASDKSTMWYNANAFKNAGISSPPSTWQDLIKDAKTLSASGVPVPISVGGGDGWTLTDWFENVYLRTAGVQKYDELTQHKIKWTDPSVTTALNTLLQIWGDKQLIGSPAAAVKVPFTASVDNVFKKNPTSALVYEASFVATTITSDKDPAVVGKDALVFPFPSINGSQPTMEAAGDFALAFTQNPVDQPFLKFLASPQAAQILVSTKGSGFLVANKNMPNSAYPDAVSAQLGKQIVDVGNNFRFDMSDQAPAAFGGTPNKGEWGDLQSFLVHQDVQAAQAQLEKDAAAAYK